MLLRRTGWNGPSFRPHAPQGETAAFPFGPGGPSARPAQPEPAFAATAPPAAATGGATTASAPAGKPVTEPLAPTPPNYTPPQFGPPTGGYRPPFAPHGPWAGSQTASYGATPPQPKPPKAPKPPRERSKLGRITFFAVLVVIGTLALISSAGIGVPVSAYFAAALATIAMGLILGAWVGRARGLIFLAILATFGLVLSSGAERFGDQIGRNDFRPRTVAAVADRYDFTVGNATLDLRAVDFTGAQQDTTVVMKFGQVKVLLPDNVDATVSVDMDGGRANVFGKESDGKDVSSQDVTDLGADGAGGGSLHLSVQMNTGNVEVTR
jgi:hypothetical protein